MICGDVIEVRFTGGAFALGKRLYRVQLSCPRLPDEGHIVRKILGRGQALVVDGRVVALRCQRQGMPVVDIAAEEVEAAEDFETAAAIEEVEEEAEEVEEEVEEVAVVEAVAPHKAPKQSRRPRRTRAPSFEPSSASMPVRRVRQYVAEPPPRLEKPYLTEALDEMFRHQVEQTRSQLSDMREHCAEVTKTLMEASKRDLARYEHDRAVAELEAEKRRYLAHMHGGPSPGGGLGTLGPALQQVVLTLDKIVNGPPA